MAEIAIYNSLKRRLETIDFEFTDKNTTWFADQRIWIQLSCMV